MCNLGVMRWGLVLVAAAATAGCVRPIQMRMAEPLVSSGDSQSAPVIYFDKQLGAREASARFIEASPTDPMANRVNLRPNAAYDVTMVLPPDYEQRRMQTLQTREQQLLSAIQMAESRLRENVDKEAQLLSHAARAQLIEDTSDLRMQIDQAKVLVVSAPAAIQRSDAQRKVDELTRQASASEALLRQDDEARDTLLPQPVVESLVNQLQDLRTDLNETRSRLLSLQLLMANTSEPYPRVINGIVETRDRTRFTEAGSIPLSVTDEYLDWIREGKVVTIVSFDPNEPPADERWREYRETLPEQWPERDLMIIERSSLVAGAPRLASGGTGPNAQILENRYPNVVARTYRDPAGGMRTYLSTTDGTRVWVFGPDVTPPANVEVWAGGMGRTAVRLYPPNERDHPEEAFVRQIAGVEGGAFDPVREAEKRGQVVAITRLGNVQRGSDDAKVHKAAMR
jgi:hypothetical protein